MRFLVFLFFGLFACFKAAAQCDNLKPMFGDNCTKSAKLRKADETFKKTAAQKYGSPDSAAKAYLYIAWEHFQKKADSAAMKSLNQAWLLNPQNPHVYFAFGHLVRYAFQKNAADAERYFKQARLNDRSHQAERTSLLWLLTALDARKDPQAALDASSDLVVKFPEYGNGLGYKKRAYYYTTLQMPDRAILDYEKALAIDPKDANSYVGRGYAYSWQRNHQKALSDYNQAISIDPKLVNAYATRAQLYADSLNKPDLALQDLDKALGLNPKEPEFYKMKSKVLLQLNRKPEACACLKNGIDAGHKSLVAEFKAKCGK